MDELISRQAAIDALWEVLYEYEDKTEKQFQESNELDIGDWILYRIFVQNMNDIDRQTIQNLPPVQSEIVRCKDCKHKPNRNAAEHDIIFPDDKCPCQCEDYWYSWIPRDDWYCGNAERKEVME